MNLITCKNLVKSYRKVRAIDDLSLNIEAGKPVALIGPNGAGKTTLFSLIAGFLKADAGSLQVFGHSPQANALKGKVGILPQDSPFLKGISIKSQLKLFAQLQGLNGDEATVETRRVMNDFNVTDLIKRKPHQLSYGQRKRIALAQALIGRPKLALLDEPTSGLDPVAANDVRQLIRRNQSETTFFISSHNLDELEDLCQTIVLIDKGKLVISSTLADLKGQGNFLTFLLSEPATDSLIDDIRQLQHITELDWQNDDKSRLTIAFDTEQVNQIQAEIMAVLQKHQVNVMEFSRGKTLSDRILKLVKGDENA